MKSYADVAAWGSMNGHGEYNGILVQMEKDRMIPGYESTTWDLYTGVGRDYGYSDSLSSLLDAYVKEFGPCTIEI